MSENKTKPTAESVERHLAAITDEPRRKDCQELVKLMTQASKEKPQMWGSSIVGFGSYHYKYDSGREGDWCLVGFASRKNDITLYLGASSKAYSQLLARLGKHKMGKGCLYIRKLSNVDTSVLEQLVALSVTESKQRHT